MGQTGDVTAAQVDADRVAHEPIGLAAKLPGRTQRPNRSAARCRGQHPRHGLSEIGVVRSPIIFTVGRRVVLALRADARAAVLPL